MGLVMRQVGLAVLVAVAAVSGCNSFRDVFTSHAETAARVGSRELKSVRVAEIIAKLGGPSANPQAAELVAGIWVDLSLFADKVAAGSLKTDSATMERLMWPQLAEHKVSSWHDSLVARRPEVTVSSADSAFGAGELRLFQHILFMAGGATAADTAKAAASAARVLPMAKSGDFGKLAAQYSGDGSKADNGFLFVSGRGAFVPTFEQAAWELQPGAVSGVVKSEFGFHIIRRPTLSESRDRFLSKLKEVHRAQQDSLYMEGVNQKHAITVKAGAAAAIRGALADLSAARKSGKALVATKGGDFTVGQMVRWLDALPNQALAQIRAANDTLLESFAKTLAQNSILLKEADSAKIIVNSTIYQALLLQHQSQLTNLTEALALNSTEFSDSSKLAVPERRGLAAKKVDEYFEKLISGQAQFRPMPPTLSAELRTAADFKIYQAGVSRAIELIVQKKAADSVAGITAPPPGGPPAGAPQPGGLQAAPGGPPGQAPRP
jgi:hypothetical protein